MNPNRISSQSLDETGRRGCQTCIKRIQTKIRPASLWWCDFFGLRGVVIKSHGGTDAVGFAYALEEAFHEAQADSLHKIEQSVATQLTQFQEKKNAGRTSQYDRKWSLNSLQILLY